MKIITILIILFLSISSVLFSQVAINYDGSQPTTHSVLDIKSDTTGMLIPRMTTIQRGVLANKLDNSHEGMIIYDKTGNVLFFWNGSEFEVMQSGIISEIADADNDTYVDVEEGIDPDYVSIGTNGVNYWRFEDGRLEFLSTGGSVFIGENAGQNDDFTDNENSFVGFNAGYATSTGSQNVAVGRSALTGNLGGLGNTAVGAFSLYTASNAGYNVGFGLSSLYANTNGQYNTAIGTKALMSNTEGNSNTSIGRRSLYTNTTGSYNIALGYNADYYNETGANNIIIGYQAGFVGFSHSKSGNILIGYQAGFSESGSNKLYIENSNSSTPLIYGDFSSNQLGFMGDVGIGTKTPESNLHIVGSSTLGSLLISPDETLSGDDSEVLFAEDANNTYGMSIKYDGGDNRMYFYGKNDAAITDPLLTVERDGNIGIGTSNPSELFEVVSSGNIRTASFTGEGIGIADATIYSDNTSAGGIAGYFQTTGTDATIVLKQTGAGKVLKAFGPNGGGEEWNVGNDGLMEFYNSNGNRTIEIDPSETGTTDAGQIRLYSADGSAVTIEIDGSYNGDGRIITNELQITGGSDLSEFFEFSDYRSIEKGMVVSIDENNPGQLKVCEEKFDKKVAGIVSGANEINPGLIMSQKGTIADGEHLIALSGRVYCMVDASEDPVEIGDMLTTSSTPGYAMKVDDYSKAQGAIIGKAMTSLSSGKGMVLVLVSLQ
ncbi:MAG: hypothetical protein HQ521_17410 [Bacteroidetes bacterium]|nr:hypothetical protein [Bacteroidota bacterium]